MQHSPSAWRIVLVLLATALIRVAALLSDWGSLELDTDSYARLAINWAHTGIYGFAVADQYGSPLVDADPEARVLERAIMQPTAYRPPLYPWLLSWFVRDGQLSPVSIAVLHVCLGMATVLLVMFVAQRLGVQWPWLPALAVACDPLLLRGSQLVMTETLVTFFAVAIWAVWLFTFPRSQDQSESPSGLRTSKCSGAIALGVLLGLSVLTRPTMLPWAVCLFALLFVRERRTIGGLMTLLLGTLMFTAALVPWALRNERVFDRPIITTTHGGYTLLLANNPLLFSHFEQAGASRDWDASEFHRRWALRRSGDPRDIQFWMGPIPGAAPTLEIDELTDDRLAQQAAVATIQRRPLMFALASLYRVGWFWAAYPNEVSLSVQLAVGCWYVGWFLLAVWGAVRIGRAWLSPTWLAPVALLLTLTGIHAIYWSNMRMRSPLMPIVYVVAGLSLSGLAGPPTSTSAAVGAKSF